MQHNGFHRILEGIALDKGSTTEEVRRELQLAMEAALQNPDPVVQAMWASIPRKGEQLTVEEFMEYLIGQNLLLP